MLPKKDISMDHSCSVNKIHAQSDSLNMGNPENKSEGFDDPVDCLVIICRDLDDLGAERGCPALI